MNWLPAARQALAATAAVCIMTPLVYVGSIRPIIHALGATTAEAAAPMAGDEIVRHPFFNATRAITIHAAPRHVWPWLVQIGSGRAGWYSFDRVDNGGVPSSTTVVPALQHLAVGDLVPMVPGESIGPRVKALTPERSMLWGDADGRFTWLWQLEPIADGGTRLITRVRAVFPWSNPVYGVLADVGDVLFMRRSLRGIRARAEWLAANPPPAADDPYNRAWPCTPR
jgi:hypothetical protein